MNPPDEEIAVLLGDSEHVRDGADRNVLGVARRGVAFAVGDELVDQFVADRAHPRLELFHRVRRERRQQQLLGRLVLGRIGRDRRRPRRDFRAARRARSRGARRNGRCRRRFPSPPDRWSACSSRGTARCERPATFARNSSQIGNGFSVQRRIGVVEIVDPVGDRRMCGHDAGGIGHQERFLCLVRSDRE